MKHFKSSWDSTLKFHSALLSLILLISVGTLVNRQSYIMAGLILLIPLAAKIFSVSEYTTDEADLKIRRPIGSVTIPLSKISLARRLSEEELSSTIRLFGIGGLFGHWGYFYSSKLGRLRIYSTKSRDLVLIKANGLIVLSPDDPDAFLKELPVGGKDNHSTDITLPND